MPSTFSACLSLLATNSSEPQSPPSATRRPQANSLTDSWQEWEGRSIPSSTVLGEDSDWSTVGHMFTPRTNHSGQGDEGRLMARAGSGAPTPVARGGPVSRRRGEGLRADKGRTAVQAP